MRKSDAHRRNHRSGHLPATVIALAALATFALVSAAFGQAPQAAVSATTLRGDAQVGFGPATRPAGELASGSLRTAVARLEAGKAAPASVDMVGREGIRIEILHSLGAGALRDLVDRLGGTRLRPVDASTAEAVVPYDELEALEADPGVSFVRPPLDIAAPQAPIKPFAGSILGQHVAKTNASNWHQNGRAGAGVKSRDHRLLLGLAVERGDLLRRSAQPGRCLLHQRRGSLRLLDGDPGTHGVSVAEIIHDMAPNAQIYLGHTRANSAADLHAVVDYFASQGVRVISRSLAAQYDGPGTAPARSQTWSTTPSRRGWLVQLGRKQRRAGRLWLRVILAREVSSTPTTTNSSILGKRGRDHGVQLRLHARAALE